MVLKFLKRSLFKIIKLKNREEAKKAFVDDNDISLPVNLQEDLKLLQDEQQFIDQWDLSSEIEFFEEISEKEKNLYPIKSLEFSPSLPSKSYRKKPTLTLDLSAKKKLEEKRLEQKANYEGLKVIYRKTLQFKLEPSVVGQSELPLPKHNPIDPVLPIVTQENQLKFNVDIFNAALNLEKSSDKKFIEKAELLEFDSALMPKQDFHVIENDIFPIDQEDSLSDIIDDGDFDEKSDDIFSLEDLELDKDDSHFAEEDLELDKDDSHFADDLYEQIYQYIDDEDDWGNVSLIDTNLQKNILSRLSIEERATQIATIIIVDADIDRCFLFLIKSILVKHNCHIKTQNAIRNLIEKHEITLSELEALFKLREYWQDSQYTRVMRGANYKQGWPNIPWNMGLLLLRALGTDNYEETVFFIENSFDDWCFNERLLMAFPNFIGYLANAIDYLEQLATKNNGKAMPFFFINDNNTFEDHGRNLNLY